MASRRLLPVPRRHPGRRQRRRHGDHPAGRLDPRRDGDRGRRPAPPRDGVHGAAPLPPLTRGGGPHGTAARPRDGAGHRGRGDRVRAVHGPRRSRRGGPRGDRGDAPDDGRDRHRRHDRDRRGRAGRGADAVHRRAGRPPRRGRGRGRGVDIAVDPLEGTNLVATGQGGRDHGARRVREGRPDARPGHLPREAVRRARSPPAASTSPGRRPRTATGSPRRSGAGRAGHHGDHPRPAAPRVADRRGPLDGRPDQAHLATATSRPPSRARSRAPASTR